MKLRIKGNSIRLRLLRNEVERFAAEKCISEETDFGTSVLRYSLVISKDARSVSAAFNENGIEIFIPEAVARDWTNSEAVGVGSEDGGLTILIEKDFVCLDRPDDHDRGQAFPNPNAVC